MATGDNLLPFPKVDHAPPAPSVPELNEVIGSVLRDERERQDRTLSDVAEEAAVSLPYLSEVERGRKEPSSPVLRSICDALEIPVPDLLEESARRLRELSPSSSAGFQLLAA